MQMSIHPNLTKTFYGVPPGGSDTEELSSEDSDTQNGVGS